MLITRAEEELVGLANFISESILYKVPNQYALTGLMGITDSDFLTVDKSFPE
jgi:hypothetical protein